MFYAAGWAEGSEPIVSQLASEPTPAIRIIALRCSKLGRLRLGFAYVDIRKCSEHVGHFTVPFEPIGSRTF